MNVTQETFHSRTASGEQEPLFGNYFVSTYPPFYCWTTNAPGLVDPLQETADRSAGDVPLGLYVHIPFCAKRCEYCYYLTRTDPSRQAMDRYLDAILKEASMYAAAPALAGRTISFAYIGGGTPSLLSVQTSQDCCTA